MFKYFIYKFGQFCVTHLPLAMSYRLAKFIAYIQYLVSFRDRRAVKNNLRAILPHERDVTPLTKDVFCHFAMYLVEFFRMARKIDRTFVEKNVEVKNVDYVSEALERKKGVIFLTAHIGNWELGGFVLSLLGYESVAIALPHKERPVNELFNRQRAVQGITIVPTSQAVRKCISILQGNGTIAVVGDRDFSANGIVMDFLHKKVLIPKGAAMLAIKTGAAIIPAFFIRKKNDTFVMQFEKPVYPPTVSNGHVDDQALVSLIKQYIKPIEDTIYRYPSQWLMFRQYWVE